MDGAGRIDVEAKSYPPELPGWVILRTPGRSDAPDRPAWLELVHQVEGWRLPRCWWQGRRSKEPHRGAQHTAVTGAALAHPVSRQWSRYWQKARLTPCIRGEPFHYTLLPRVARLDRLATSN